MIDKKKKKGTIIFPDGLSEIAVYIKDSKSWSLRINIRIKMWKIGGRSYWLGIHTV